MQRQHGGKVAGFRFSRGSAAAWLVPLVAAVGCGGAETETGAGGASAGGSPAASADGATTGAGTASGGLVCDGNFTIGTTFQSCPDCGLGQACDGALPKNCADGTWIERGEECICVAQCSSFQDNPQPGEPCFDAGWSCQHVENANANSSAKLCVKDEWNLCTADSPGGAGATGPTGGGTTAATTSGAGATSASSGGGCSQPGGSCATDDDCCFGLCDTFASTCF